MARTNRDTLFQQLVNQHPKEFRSPQWDDTVKLVEYFYLRRKLWLYTYPNPVR